MYIYDEIDQRILHALEGVGEELFRLSGRAADVVDIVVECLGHTGFPCVLGVPACVDGFDHLGGGFRGLIAQLLLRFDGELGSTLFRLPDLLLDRQKVFPRGGCNFLF